jgi:hypothetical protein
VTFDVSHIDGGTSVMADKLIYGVERFSSTPAPDGVK